MENKAHALMAGIFTIALLTAAVLIALWFNRDHVERQPYEIATTLSVPGLNPQAGVRYRGLDVGRVDAVLFDPQKPGQILIRFSVSKDTPIPHSTFATLSYQGVTGLAYLQLDDDGKDPTLMPTSKNKPARIMLRPGLLDTLQLRGLAILQQTEELAARANALLSDANMKTAAKALQDVGRAAHKLAQVSDKLQPTIERLPELAQRTDNVLISLNRLSGDAATLTHNLNIFTAHLNAANGPLSTLGHAADNVGSAAATFEYQAVPLINDTRSAIRALNRTLETFNQRPQSILFGAPPMPPGPGEPGFSAPVHPSTAQGTP